MRTAAVIAALLAGCGSDSSGPSADASPPDATPMADAAPMIDAEPNLTPEQACIERYGSLTGFQLCTANTNCAFFAQTGGMTCIDLCADFGGLCINSHDGECATRAPPLQSCQSTDPDQVCICSLL